MDVVGGEGKAAGAALCAARRREYTESIPARKGSGMARSGYPLRPMRTIAMVLGVLIAIGGAVWIAQGLNLPFAPRSFMTADRTWVVLGFLAVVLGFATFTWARRRP
jgi:hypothetical protein